MEEEKEYQDGKVGNSDLGGGVRGENLVEMED